METYSDSDFFIPWIHSSVPKSNAVAIICAGPSTKKYAKKAKQWIKKNSAKVFAANYNYGDIGLKSHYTYITDHVKFFEVIEDIDSHIIVPYKMKGPLKKTKMIKKFGENWRRKIKQRIKHHKKKGKKVFRAGYFSRKKNRVIDTTHIYSKRYGGGYIRHILTMGKYGEFRYERFGPAGQGAMLMSLVLKPKKMLVIGLDGPNSLVGNIFTKKMYNGTEQPNYGDANRVGQVTKFIQNVLIPTIKFYNVNVMTYSGVGFYGLDKAKLGLKVI
jgi:hypothetical protein